MVPDANLELDLGLDSMERVELLTALEQRFAADIPEEQLQRLYTVRELAEGILEHSKGDGAEGSAAWDALLAPSAIDSSAFDEWMQPHWFVPAVLFGVLKAIQLLLRPGVRIDRSRHRAVAADGRVL